MKPTLALTLGDVNGVGPEILVKALARPAMRETFHPVVFGSQEILQAVRPLAPGCPPFALIEDVKEVSRRGETVPVMDGGLTAPSRRPGTLDAEAGRCAIEWLKLAIRLAVDRALDGIVTCPLNKEGIHLAGYAYAGHTEVLAEMTSSPDYRMCLFSDRMRIVHISSHCSLLEALRLVERERIATSIRVGHDALTRLGLPRRRIAVAGLNPHAGEAGLFGDEELREIQPAIEQCRCEGVECSGPYAPDTVFRRMWSGAFDLVVAMYHDQGHIPLKLVAMDEGVNVTLGLPIVRTSVDHGTAYDIAGRGCASEDSLCNAIELAARLAQGVGK
jgi:4-hydroxythreonine-4-phosphate dehydrogenase